MNTILWYMLLDCPTGCEYCFEDENKPSIPGRYNKEAMAATLRDISKQWGKDEHPQVILHGGDVTSLPIEDFKFSLETIKSVGGQPSMQTALWNLTAEHIRLIKEYHMQSVGVSIDGPAKFNTLRGPRDKKANREYQKRLQENIKWLKDEGIKVGTITVLTKLNASPSKIDELIRWGIETKSDGRYNQMFLPSCKASHLLKYKLSPEELKIAFLKFAQAYIEHPNEFRPAVVIENMKNLKGQGLNCCLYTRCDYLVTRCTTIMPDGNLSRCDRCFESGYYYQPHQATLVRSEMLKQTQCKGCRYFEICAGGCPAEGVGGDVRNKTEFCEAYYALLQYLERHIRAMDPGRRLAIDVPNFYQDYYLKNKWVEPYPQQQQRHQQPACQPRQQVHGDSESGGHGDYDDHGDSPHCDSWGA